MKYLSEATVQAVLVAATGKGLYPLEGTVKTVVDALIEADKVLDTYVKGESWKDAKAPAVEQPPYPPVTDQRTIHAMSISDSTFRRVLATLWELADANNRKRIRTTWADEFRKVATAVHYCEMARQAELEGRN
jgi:hypothetical protein